MLIKINHKRFLKQNVKMLAQMTNKPQNHESLKIYAF